MKNVEQVFEWVAGHPLQPQYIDCAIAVMLKILDGKCKMNAEEKQVMRHLYCAVKHHRSDRLDPNLHRLIESAERHADEALREQIYELRVLAETVISRPVMKGFKRWIREHGLFESDVSVAAG